MKKILGIVTALAVMGGVSFAQELKTATLESPVGKISFGAWGRSTFEIGREQIKTKLDVSADAATQALLDTATTTYDGAYAAVTAAEEAYEEIPEEELPAEEAYAEVPEEELPVEEAYEEGADGALPAEETVVWEDFAEEGTEEVWNDPADQRK